MKIAEQIAWIKCSHRQRGADPPCKHCIRFAERRIAAAPTGMLDIIARHFSEGSEPTALCYIEALDLLAKLQGFGLEEIKGGGYGG